MQNIYGLSFPKAGRTWLRLMIAKIYADLTNIELRTILKQEHGKVNDYKEQSLICNNGSMLPHILFRHGPEKGRISQEKYFPSFYINKKAFILVRNPLDVVVSFYYHKKYYRKKFYNGTLADFVQYPYLSVDPQTEESRFGLMPIINYMNAMIENKDKFGQLKVFFYEDFIQDPLSNIRSLMQFCVPFSVNEQLLIDAVAYCTFDNMRRLEEQNVLQWHALPGGKNCKEMKTRKGKNESYKKEFSVSEIDQLQLLVNKNLNPFYEKYYI